MASEASLLAQKGRVSSRGCEGGKSRRTWEPIGHLNGQGGISYRPVPNVKSSGACRHPERGPIFRRLSHYLGELWDHNPTVNVRRSIPRFGTCLTSSAWTRHSQIPKRSLLFQKGSPFSSRAFDSPFLLLVTIRRHETASVPYPVANDDVYPHLNVYGLSLGSVS